MSSPYTGATSAGTPQDYAQPAAQNYAADYSQDPHSGAMGTPTTESGHPDVEGVSVGALIGESIGFALGRYFGPWIRRSRLGGRIGERNWVRAENYLARRGGIAVFISRFLPVLHSLIPLTVGMSGMRYRTFLAWTAPACIVWAALYVSVGQAATTRSRRRPGRVRER